VDGMTIVTVTAAAAVINVSVGVATTWRRGSSEKNEQWYVPARSGVAADM